MAQTTPTKLQSPSRTRLKANDKAPFTGTLLSDEALAKIISESDRQIALLKLEIEKLKRDAAINAGSAEATCKAKLDGADAKLKATEGGFIRERAIYDRELERLGSVAAVPWYKQPYFHLIVGSIVGGGICAAATRLN